MSEVASVAKASLLDFYGQTSTPANPPANEARMFYDEVANQLKCIDSHGTSVIGGGINAMGNVSGSITIDLSKGNVITMTLTGNVTASSFSNAVASVGQEVTFIITQDGTGFRTFAWPSAVVPSGIAPVPQISPGAVSVLNAVIDGSGNANFVANGPVVVFRQRNTGLTASGGNGQEFSPPAIGIYRVITTASCTTAGTTATMTPKALTAQSTVSGTACNSTSIADTTGAENYGWAYGVGTSSPTTKMGYSWTLTNAIGAAVFQVDCVVEYLGN